MRKRISPLLAVAAVLAWSASAVALDANDIVRLLQNQIDENVITGMVESNKLASPLSATQVIAISNAGASPDLLSFLTSLDASVLSDVTVGGTGESGVIESNPPGIVYIEPGSGYDSAITSEPQVTYVEPQPSVVVTSPPVVYYEPSPTIIYDRSPIYSSSSFWWGSRPPYHYRPPSRPPHRPPNRPGGPPPGGRPPGGRPPGGRPPARPPGERPPGGRPTGGRQPSVRPPGGGGGRPLGGRPGGSRSNVSPGGGGGGNQIRIRR